MPLQAAAEALVASSIGTEDENILRQLAAAALAGMPAQGIPPCVPTEVPTEAASTTTAMHVDQEAATLAQPQGIPNQQLAEYFMLVMPQQVEAHACGRRLSLKEAALEMVEDCYAFNDKAKIRADPAHAGASGALGITGSVFGSAQRGPSSSWQRLPAQTLAPFSARGH